MKVRPKLGSAEEESRDKYAHLAFLNSLLTLSTILLPD